jgi:hypothetical protein
VTTYPAEPTGLEQAEALAADNPIPAELRKQIGNWIEPQTMNTETKHRDAMACVDIAYPLIRAYIGERERLVHDDPQLAQQIREGVADAERGDTVYLGSFAQFLDEPAADA